MKCNNCGWANPDNALKCENCNAPLHGSMIKPVSEGPKKEVSKNGKECKNCGSINPVEALKCENCNAPLQGSMIIANPDSASTKKQETPQPVEETLNCPSCGYPNIPNVTHCVQCNYQFNQPSVPKTEPITQKSTPPSAKTITPWEEENQQKLPAFTLTPLDHESKQPLETLNFEGEEVTLNRKSIDPDNTTITGKKQATITNQNGEWIISNDSKLQTTFIQVKNDQPVTLKDGDVILMGNRLFVFSRGSY